MPLRAVARVNLAAIERNVDRLKRGLTPGTSLCAVVKADGYGHGAEPAARAALRGGASSLAVATAQEAAALRCAGIGDSILVMGAISADELPVALTAGAELTAWSEPFVAAVADRRFSVEPAGGRAAAVRLHAKLDSGMGRLGTRDLGEAVRVAERVMASPGLELAGAMTHFATADGDLEFVDEQLARFRPFVSALRELRPGVVAHAANSAGTLRVPASHFDMVRCGVAIYGCDPMNEDPDRFGLEPALELGSYIAVVKLARPGESAGYGRRFIAERDTWLGTIPIGYGDGFRRAFTNNCEVLVGGRRYPLAGTVSMDNIAVELGHETGVRAGEAVTIIGRDGSERQTAEDLALRIHTINYEIVCGLSARVPRAYHRDGEPCE